MRTPYLAICKRKVILESTKILINFYCSPSGHPPSFHSSFTAMFHCTVPFAAWPLGVHFQPDSFSPSIPCTSVCCIPKPFPFSTIDTKHNLEALTTFQVQCAFHCDCSFFSFLESDPWEPYVLFLPM